MLLKCMVNLLKVIRRQAYKIQYAVLRMQANKMSYVCGLNKKRRSPKIIVSMTTFPKRISEIDLCIKSILNQSYKPDKIIIWLGSDVTEELAEKYLEKYKEYGIEYVIDKEYNYYSHKKYIYAFKRYPNSIIITLDDDLIYPRDTIKSLVKKHNKYPNAIVARRVHEITWKDYDINNYNKWNWACFTIKKPSYMLFATTGAGTLFPPSIYSEEDLNYDIIKKYALTADDIWLNMMAVKNNVKVVWAGNFLQMPPTINNENNEELSSINVSENRNDVYIRKIIKDFELKKYRFQ